MFVVKTWPFNSCLIEKSFTKQFDYRLIKCIGLVHFLSPYNSIKFTSRTDGQEFEKDISVQHADV
jgi:hypothetical protein